LEASVSRGGVGRMGGKDADKRVQKVLWGRRCTSERRIVKGGGGDCQKKKKVGSDERRVFLIHNRYGKKLQRGVLG